MGAVEQAIQQRVGDGWVIEIFVPGADRKLARDQGRSQAVPVFNQVQQIVPLLGIPDGLDVLAILPFGYPIRAVSKGKKRRKPLNEVAYRERFGQPL
jgi:nitroreductase